MTKQYDSYKPSGVEWLGEIPSHWKLQKSINVVDIRDGTHDSPRYQEKKEDTYPFITSKNIKNGKIDFSDCKYVSKQDYLNIVQRSNVDIGDILMPMIGTIGNPAIADVSGFAIKNVALFKEKKILQNKFLIYLINSSVFEDYLKVVKAGGVVGFISLGDIRNWKIAYPSIIEQTAIANYLDNKTTAIDGSIETLKVQKKTLIEQKKAIIHKAVTQGLDSSVPMKDSGVEWIGMVPEHWGVIRGKDCFFYEKNKNNGMKEKNLLSLTYKGVLNRDINSSNGLRPDSYETYQIVNKDDLIFKLIDLENKKTSRVGIVHEKGIMSSAYIKLVSRNNIYSKYFYHYFYDMYQLYVFNYLGGNGVRSTLNYGDLLKIKNPLPPKDEQKQIVRYLELKISKIDEAVAEVDRQISLLEEYKKTIINDVVTGKKLVYEGEI